MGMDIFTDTVVGVSFINQVKDDSVDENKFEKVADEVGLDFAVDMYKPEKISDAFIGVRFSERPTDAEVEAAKKKVSGVLDKIEELMEAEADSEIGIWNTVTISV